MPKPYTLNPNCHIMNSLIPAATRMEEATRAAIFSSGSDTAGKPACSASARVLHRNSRVHRKRAHRNVSVVVGLLKTKA